MSEFTILVVDDDSMYRETLVAYAKKKGFKVLEAQNGNEAFTIIKAQPISGVITDLRMPNGTGIELLKKIRNWGKELPLIPKIIVNTGLLDGGEHYLKSLGALHVFLKPVELKKLLDCLAEEMKNTSSVYTPPIST